jgi:hypothetical protein
LNKEEEFMITTKDLMALNELMTFENWFAVKLVTHSKALTGNPLKKQFVDMAKAHADQHKALLNFLDTKESKRSGK